MFLCAAGSIARCSNTTFCPRFDRSLRSKLWTVSCLVQSRCLNAHSTQRKFRRVYCVQLSFFVFCAHMFLCSDTRALTWSAQLFVESNKMCITFFLLPGAAHRNWTAGAVTRKNCNKLHPAGIDVEHQFTIRDTFARCFWRKFGSFVPLRDFSLRWCVREQTADKRHMSRYLPQDSGAKTHAKNMSHGPKVSTQRMSLRERHTGLELAGDASGQLDLQMCLPFHASTPWRKTCAMTEFFRQRFRISRPSPERSCAVSVNCRLRLWLVTAGMSHFFVLCSSCWLHAERSTCYRCDRHPRDHRDRHKVVELNQRGGSNTVKTE